MEQNGLDDHYTWPADHTQVDTLAGTRPARKALKTLQKPSGKAVASSPCLVLLSVSEVRVA